MSTTCNWSVYVLTVPNGKVYVGVTSKTPRVRWQYGHGYSGNKAFYADIKKYGWKAISQEIVAVFDNADEAYELEKKLIKQYDSTNLCHGYNRSTGGSGTFGVQISEETRKRLSDSHKGKNHPHHNEWNKNISNALKAYYKTHEKPKPPYMGRPVLQYTKNMELVREYQSAHEAQRQTNIRNQSIYCCCSGRTKTAGGYIWKYKV